MLFQSLLLVVGLALLIKGGEIFVSASVRIAEFLRMPRVVIGSTLVSLATTTPELVVSITAGAQGQSNLAVGNAVGSCICNIGLILGLTAALKHVDVHPRSLRLPLLALFGFGALLVVLTLNLQLSRLEGWLLIAAGLAYFSYDFVHHARTRRPEVVAEACGIEKDIAPNAPASSWLHTRFGAALQFVTGALIVVLGSRLLVGAAVNLATAVGISPLVIGLTVIAVGTSLPELITAVSSSRQNASDLAIGNVLGANVANLTLILGTAAALSDVTLTRPSQLYNFSAMLVMCGALLWMLLTESRVTRKEGVTLLVLYVFYLSGLVLLTAAQRS